MTNSSVCIAGASLSDCLESYPEHSVGDLTPLQGCSQCILHPKLTGLFTPVLTDGLSVKLEWQQVNSRLQDCSQYSGRPQQCCSLNLLCSSSGLPLFQFPSQAFGDRSKHTNYDCYQCHPNFPQFLLVLWQGLSTYFSFCFLLFSLSVPPRRQNLLLVVCICFIS